MLPNSSSWKTTADVEPSCSQWHLSLVQKTLAVAAMAILCLVVQASNLGIIYYEKVVADTHRTLLNKLAALTSAYQVGLATVGFPTLIVRLLLGVGLGHRVCLGFNVICTFLMAQLVLVYNELCIMRYVYICRLGTVGMLKEELVLHIFVWLNLVLGAYLSLTLGMTPRLTNHVVYSFCNNETHAILGMLQFCGVMTVSFSFVLNFR